MLPVSQKPGLQPALNASFAKLPLLPHQTDVRSCPQMAIRSIAFVAKVVPQVVHAVCLHISVRIWA